MSQVNETPPNHGEQQRCFPLRLPLDVEYPLVKCLANIETAIGAIVDNIRKIGRHLADLRDECEPNFEQVVEAIGWSGPIVNAVIRFAESQLATRMSDLQPGEEFVVMDADVELIECLKYFIPTGLTLGQRFHLRIRKPLA